MGLIGNSVLLLYHEEVPQRIEVICEEKSHGFLVALNPQINSRVRRNTGKETELIPVSEDNTEPPIMTMAAIVAVGGLRGRSNSPRALSPETP